MRLAVTPFIRYGHVSEMKNGNLKKEYPVEEM